MHTRKKVNDFLGRSLRVVSKLSSRFASWARKKSIQWKYPGCQFDRGVTIGHGCTIRATDGGTIHLGHGTTIKNGCVIICKAGLLDIGSSCFIGWGTVICANQSIRIGDDCLIAEHVTIRDHRHGYAVGGIPFGGQPTTTDPIVLGCNVWVGAKATVLAGVQLEESTIVGANALVNRNAGPNEVVAGVPARVIRSLKPDEP